MSSLEETTENKFNISIFTGFILIGFFIIIFFGKITEDGRGGPATASLWGYSLMLFSLFGIIFVKIKMINDKKGGSLMEYIIGEGAAFFLLMFNILWLISMNVNYYTVINTGNVSKDFYEYSKLNSILIFIQILISLEVILSEVFVGSSILDKMTKSTDTDTSQKTKNTAVKIIAFIFVITNFVLSGIQQTTLDFFTTDG